MMDLKKIREGFPVLRKDVYGKRLVYLDNAATTQKPQEVIDAILDFYTTKNANIHRGAHHLSEEASGAYESARDNVSDFIGAKEDEVVFTSGTTASINIVASHFANSLNKGDEIIVSELEHHSNFVPWQEACKRSGAKLKVIPITSDGCLDLEGFESLFSKNTRLLAISHVSNVLGTVSPIKEMTRLAHEKGVSVLLDAAQSAAHRAIDVKELDCDFLAFSGHKIYGPTGTGVLYGRREELEDMSPCRYGGGMIEKVSKGSSKYLRPPLRFEAGTPNIAGVVGLSAAIDYLNSISLTEVERQESKVYDYAVEELEKIDGLKIYGTDPRCSALSFNLKGVHHYDLGSLLDKMGIAIRTGSHCAEPLIGALGLKGTVRASFAIYNIKEEVDILAEGITSAGDILNG